jgi:1,4-alpha-glucan branching enzyme
MPTHSHRPGLGANAYDGGVSFRFWAPFANSVAIIGIGTWTPPGISLAPEGNGYWSADINGITTGQEYKVLVNGRWRMDPRARDVTSSTGNCVVDNTAFAWQNDFQMPGWNELVIYEMHLGTFPDDPAPAGQVFDAAIKDLGYLRDLGINAIHFSSAYRGFQYLLDAQCLRRKAGQRSA